MKQGIDTSEYRVTRTSEIWGIIIMVLGIIVTSGSLIVSAISDVSTLGSAIAGTVIAVIGIILKGIVSKEYVKGRAALKIEEAKVKDGG